MAASSSLGKGPLSKSVAVKTLEDGGCLTNDSWGSMIMIGTCVLYGI